LTFHFRLNKIQSLNNADGWRPAIHPAMPSPTLPGNLVFSGMKRLIHSGDFNSVDLDLTFSFYQVGKDQNKPQFVDYDSNVHPRCKRFQLLASQNGPDPLDRTFESRSIQHPRAIQ
jgi:hypothetical protein